MGLEGGKMISLLDEDLEVTSVPPLEALGIPEHYTKQHMVNNSMVNNNMMWLLDEDLESDVITLWCSRNPPNSMVSNKMMSLLGEDLEVMSAPPML